MSDFPRITFGMIVLNGEPFTRYNLRTLYPFAHEIIVVEGAVSTAADLATPEGHSPDGTLETLYRFKSEEDPDDKLQIVTRDGFWTEKDEMSQAYAERSTGDYLWQVDSDEFYQPEDMRAILAMLRDDPSITAMSFRMLTFWGAPDYIADGWYLRRGANIYHRLFRWGGGYRYVTHRPPTICDEQGRNLRDLRWIHGRELARRGVFLYHYSLLFPKQVDEKCAYYSQATWARRSGALAWAEECYRRLDKPFRVHNVYTHRSWLERYSGAHPPEIMAMWQDCHAGKIAVELRRTDDVERLLASPRYRLERVLSKILDYLDRMWGKLRKQILFPFARRIVPGRIKAPIKKWLR